MKDEMPARPPLGLQEVQRTQSGHACFRVQLAARVQSILFLHLLARVLFSSDVFVLYPRLCRLFFLLHTRPDSRLLWRWLPLLFFLSQHLPFLGRCVPYVQYLS